MVLGVFPNLILKEIDTISSKTNFVQNMSIGLYKIDFKNCTFPKELATQNKQRNKTNKLKNRVSVWGFFSGFDLLKSQFSATTSYCRYFCKANL